MKRFFRDLSLRTKLAIIGVVPLLFIIYLTADLYEEKNRNIATIEAYVQRVDLVGSLSRLIESLQKEQKLSFDYVLKRPDMAALSEQRHYTDSLLKILRASNDNLLKGFDEFTALRKIDTVRQAIDNYKLPPNLVTHYYSNTTFRLNTLTPITFEDKSMLEAYDDEVQAQKLLTELLTYIGIIRFNIYQVLTTRAFMVETLIGTLGAYDVSKSIEQEFSLKAPSQVVAAYKAVAERTAYKPTMDYINKLFSTFKFDSTYTSADQWWNVSEEGLKKVVGLQVSIWKSVDNNINKTYTHEVRKKNIALVLLVLMIVVVVGIISYTIATLTKLLTELKEGAERIAKGQSIEAFDISSHDAIGSLATSIFKIDENNKRLAVAAGEIGEGNFDVEVTPRSDEDMLGNAIVKMKASLQFYIDEIEEREFRFRQLADLIPQIVWTTDPATGKADYVNKQWYAYGGDIEFMDAIHPKDVEGVSKAWNKAVESGSDYSVEFRLQKYDTKEYRWFLSRAIPIKDADGNVVKWFGTCTDIHEKKTMQEQLEDMVHEKTEELKRSNEDLLRFAHVASHDLKEPLRKVQIFIDRLADDLGGNVSEKSKDYIAKILSSSQRLMNMIEGILVYSTINSGELPMEEIDLNRTVSNVRDDLELVIEQKHAIIRHSNLPIITGVPVLIQQLVYNLVSNGLKFSRGDGPPVISITSGEVTIDSKTAHRLNGAEGKYLQLRIEDNGIGFNQDYAEKVFDVFTRLHAKAQYEGTGLGLALCKKIISRHNGFIYATSEEGVGSVFYLLFPMHLVQTKVPVESVLTAD